MEKKLIFTVSHNIRQCAYTMLNFVFNQRPGKRIAYQTYYALKLITFVYDITITVFNYFKSLGYKISFLHSN